MDDFPRQTLRRIVAKYGKDIGGDARRCEAVLNDLCGSHRREINILVNAVEEHVPLDLLAGSSSMPRELLLSRLEKRFEAQTGLTAEAARWAIESWALALGVVTDAEIEERRRKKPDFPPARKETIQPNEFENKSANQNASEINQANSIQKPKPQTAAPPTKTAAPLPPVYLPPKNHPPVRSPKANPPLQMPNPMPATKSGFGILRGCLLVIFLLFVTTVVLFFGIPYAIEVMRETQRERNNEPPRFPAR